MMPISCTLSFALTFGAQTVTLKVIFVPFAEGGFAISLQEPKMAPCPAKLLSRAATQQQHLSKFMSQGGGRHALRGTCGPPEAPRCMRGAQPRWRRPPGRNAAAALPSHHCSPPPPSAEQSPAINCQCVRAKLHIVFCCSQLNLREPTTDCQYRSSQRGV